MCAAGAITQLEFPWFIRRVRRKERTNFLEFKRLGDCYAAVRRHRVTAPQHNKLGGHGGKDAGAAEQDQRQRSLAAMAAMGAMPECSSSSFSCDAIITAAAHSRELSSLVEAVTIWCRR